MKICNIILVPAYGRSYTSKKAVLVDWETGKDFKIESGPYTSVKDKESLEKEFGTIIFKYGKKLEKRFYLM